MLERGRPASLAPPGLAASERGRRTLPWSVARETSQSGLRTAFRFSAAAPSKFPAWRGDGVQAIISTRSFGRADWRVSRVSYRTARAAGFALLWIQFSPTGSRRLIAGFPPPRACSPNLRLNPAGRIREGPGALRWTKGVRVLPPPPPNSLAMKS